MNDKLLAKIGKLVEPEDDSGFYGGDLQLSYLDFLFKYDLHSHFSFHQDMRHASTPVITVVVKLTADPTSMYVANAQETALSTDVGEAHLLLSAQFHRSGRSTARTVLATFFYSLSPKSSVKVKTEGPSSSAAHDQEGEEGEEEEEEGEEEGKGEEEGEGEEEFGREGEEESEEEK